MLCDTKQKYKSIPANIAQIMRGGFKIEIGNRKSPEAELKIL